MFSEENVGFIYLFYYNAILKDRYYSSTLSQALKLVSL